MAKNEATVEALLGMIERGELSLLEMQRRYVWRSTCPPAACLIRSTAAMTDRPVAKPQLRSAPQRPGIGSP